jgi:hypothetical protein
MNDALQIAVPTSRSDLLKRLGIDANLAEADKECLPSFRASLVQTSAKPVRNLFVVKPLGL